MQLNYRLFDFDSDSVQDLFDLFAATYGDSIAYQKRWAWEYVSNPQKSIFKIFIALDKKRIVAATTRLPVILALNNERIEAAFNCNSMVHPDFRRMGIMEELYKYSASIIPLLLSKGTLPGMYRLLKKLGYKDVSPNTFLVNVLSPLRWTFWRMGIYKPQPELKDVEAKWNGDFLEVNSFGPEFDLFFKRITPQYDCLILKNADYMNWRYQNNPYKKYKAIYHKKGEKIIAVIILSSFGSHAKIVDFLWDLEEASEPAATIDFIKRYARKCAFLKLICWTTQLDLRKSLSKRGFKDRNETPRFSSYSKHTDNLPFTGNRIGFFEGDGDSEYL